MRRIVKTTGGIPKSLSAIFFIFFLMLTTTRLSAAPIQCDRPGIADDAPAVGAFLQSACSQIATVMDHNTGAGTGALPQMIAGLRADLEKQASHLGYTDAVQAGLTYDAIREAVIVGNRGKPMPILVDEYSDAIAAGNKILHDSGLGFFEIQQSPLATLVEGYRNAVSRFPKKKVTPDDVKALSDAVYPGLQPHQIQLPINLAELRNAKQKLKFPTYDLIGHPGITNADSEPLSAEDAPLERERFWYRTMQAARWTVTVSVIALGSVGGAGWTGPALAELAIGSSLETQFIIFSPQWASVWAKWKFKANIAVNLGYTALMTIGKHLAEYVTGAPISFNAYEFTVKTLISTTIFVASCGALQVVTAKMRDRGTISEGKRMLLENIVAVLANFGRSFAIGAGMLSADVMTRKIFGVPIGPNEIVGWSLQAAILLVLTGPLWIREWFGEAAQARENSYGLLLRNEPTDPWNQQGWIRGTLAKISQGCNQAVAAFSRLVTPKRMGLQR